jgi:deoxyribodipyrimidine photo-lyase
MRVLYWFRNDLRLTDNRGLTMAIEKASEVIPVYIFDERLFQTRLGVPRIGSQRLRFLLESITDLQNSLRQLHSDLIVLVGDPAVLIPKLAAEVGASEVFCSLAQGSEEKQSLQMVQRRIPVTEITDGYLLDPSLLPFSIAELPDVFTQFRIKVEKQLSIQKPLPRIEKINTPKVSKCDVPDFSLFAMSMPEPHPHRIDDFLGGEQEGLNRLNYYCSSPERIGRYKETRNGLIGEYSSRFSPWLAIGAISARSIMQEVKDYEEKYGANDSSYWMFFELLWRDYFRFVYDKYGVLIFQSGGLKDKPTGSRDVRKFQSWCSGQTTCDFVNANMIELSKTGWMSNRGRQNVASFLVHDLGVDWRLGAAWFEYLLVDYDVASNYGNWLYLAGLGNDPRPNRRFNTALQQAQYDPNGEYTRLWTTP